MKVPTGSNPEALPRVADIHGERVSGAAKIENHDQFLVLELQRHVAVASSSVLLAPPRRNQGWMLMVADGERVGEYGRAASTLAVRRMSRFALRMPWERVPPGEDAPDLGAAILAEAERFQDDLAARGDARTTMTLAYISYPNLYLAHVGNTRCYVFRDGALTRLTSDHVFSGECERDRAFFSDPMVSGTFASALGGERRVSIDLRRFELLPNDVLLLCTDGVSNSLSNDELTDAIKRYVDDPKMTAKDCVRALLADAQARCGEDNLTAIVADL